MVALTGGQELVFAIVILIFVVIVLVDRASRREPPLPHSTRRLKKELDKIPYEEDE
jgi:hypothetical protein